MFLFQLPLSVLYFVKVFNFITCVSFWIYVFIQKKK